MCSSTIVAPPFSNRIFPETNIQFKYLDLSLSSDCVYSWLFTLPKLKLKKLRMGTHNINLVPAHAVIHVEHLSFSYGKYFIDIFDTDTDYSFISQAHMEKFVISNLVLKRLEIEYTAPGLLPALILKIRIDSENVKDFFEFFAHVRNFSHRFGTTLVLSPGINHDKSFGRVDSSLLADLTKEFINKKITKITWNTTRKNDQTISLLEELTDSLVVH